MNTFRIMSRVLVVVSMVSIGAMDAVDTPISDGFAGFNKNASGTVHFAIGGLGAYIAVQEYKKTTH